MSCVSGCTCAESDIDASVTAKESVNRIHSQKGVTQSVDCFMRFEVLAETSSGGHKFKISTLSVRAKEAAGEPV